MGVHCPGLDAWLWSGSLVFSVWPVEPERLCEGSEEDSTQLLNLSISSVSFRP